MFCCSHLRRYNSGTTVLVFVGIEEDVIHDVIENVPGPLMGGVVETVGQLLFEAVSSVGCGLVHAVQPNETDAVC